MQQLDEESAMLKRGLEMVDMARDWYLRQLAAVQDKQRMLGKVNYNVSAALRIDCRFMATFPCRCYWTGFVYSTRPVGWEIYAKRVTTVRVLGTAQGLLAEKFMLNG